MKQPYRSDLTHGFKVLGAAGLAALLALTGCRQAAVAAAIPVVSGISTAVGRGGNDAVPGKGVVLARRNEWQRRFENAAGQPLNGSQYRDGDTVKVAWRISLGVGRDESAIGVFEENACKARQAGPSSALARFGADSRVHSEIWKVGRQEGWKGPVMSTGKATDMFPGGIVPSYIIMTPRKGDYVFEMQWSGTSVESLESAHPCVLGWAAVPASAVMKLVVPGSGDKTAETPAPLEDIPMNDASDDDSNGGQILELSGNPEADLVRLHDVALEHEFGGQEANTQSSRQARQTTIRLLLSTPEGKKALCRATSKYHLDARKMQLWGDERTVTAQWQAAAGCPARTNGGGGEL